MLGVDKSTLIRWVQRGQITPTFKLPGSNGAYVFDRAYVERFRTDLDQVRSAAVGAAS